MKRMLSISMALAVLLAAQRALAFGMATIAAVRKNRGRFVRSHAATAASRRWAGILAILAHLFAGAGGMRCKSCGFENPSGMKFCGECAKPIGAVCPKCGAENPPWFKFCGQCSASLSPERSQPDGRRPTDSPSRVSISPGQAVGDLDGERETVIALFGDIKGSMEMMEDLDPEEARAIIDQALKLMMDAVHRYGGCVVQPTGDGIFALFGATVAHEDHPQRALYAAIRIQEDVRRYADRVRAEGRAPLLRASSAAADRPIRIFFRGMALGLMAAMLFAAGTSSALAQVQPDDVITSTSADKVKDLVSPGVLQRVKNGLAMKIVATQAIEPPPPYKAATESYASHASIAPDHHSLNGYVAGLPFPTVDPNDPDAAIKIVWNMQFRPVFTDDYDLHFVDCDFGYTKNGRQGEALESIQVGHYSGYNLVGRTEVQPLPADPDFNASGRYWLFALYPVLSPAELRGAGLIRHRFAPAEKADQIWALTPSDRRVREVGEEMMNDPGGIGQWSPDHFGGFNAKVQDYDYKFLGKKSMLASVNAAQSPEGRCIEDGRPGCAENWEMRQIEIVDAAPRNPANVGGGARIDIYVDTEIWFPPYVDTYNAAGELSQTSIYWLTNRDRTTGDATVAVYPFRRTFIVAAETQDMKRGTLTKCYLPGPDTPDREGWYINMGTVNKEFFLADAMVRVR